MAQLLKNFKPGPLDFYRKKASFDWKKMKIFLFTEDMIEYEHEVCEELQKYPDFEPTLLTPTFDELRRKVLRQAVIFQKIDILNTEHIITDLRKAPLSASIMIQLAPDSSIKHNVGHLLFGATIRSMGTERHADYLDDVNQGKIYGCFCLTEIAHGSNAKGMRTTATYDKNTKQFILNSPDFEAAKCWAGGLGQTATHAVLFAQLIVDNVKHGLHCFVVPVRDLKTLTPYPGVTVGDMGEKIGLNGIDNGFVMFENYAIPRENLLNKTGEVTEDGRYVSSFKDPNKRHGASLGGLSGGRVGITNLGVSYGIKALTIAIRYAGVRKQFGPDDSEEVPILEYQTHQNRLIPYLAAAYVLKCFSMFLLQTFYQFTIDRIFGQNADIAEDLGIELHAISSACKPVAGWVMRDAIQECRECCGGHGYLKVAGIGEIRNNHDANCTYEGENHVLIQQTSNWLLKLWPDILKGEKIATPLKSADFYSNSKQILDTYKFKATNYEQVCDTKFILDTFQWLSCYLLKISHEKFEKSSKSGNDAFWSKNNNQVFYAKNASIAYIQQFFLQRMLITIGEATDPSIKNVLLRCFSLYGLWSLEKHMTTLYQGGYAVGSAPATLVQDAVLRLCSKLKDDSVALVDAVAPPDFVLNSVLGASDGKVYDRLKSAIFQSPYAMSRPSWWQDIVNPETFLKTKL